MRCKWVPMALLIALLPLTGGAALAEGYRAWLEYEPAENGLMVKAFSEAPEDARVKYRLEAIKTGKSGRATTSQGGKVSLRQGVPTDLATLRLGLGKEDHYTIRLRVFREDELVADVSVSTD